MRYNGACSFAAISKVPGVGTYLRPQTGIVCQGVCNECNRSVTGRGAVCKIGRNFGLEFENHTNRLSAPIEEGSLFLVGIRSGRHIH